MLITARQIRLLAETASGGGFAGDSERRNGVYNEVHEDLSAEVAQKLTAEVGLCEKSIIR
jgi:hypothetical protein